MPMCALDQEFSSLRGIFDDPTCSERDRTVAAWRWGDVIGAINTTEPESIGDCVVKLRLLLDRGLGMSVGDRLDDLVAPGREIFRGSLVGPTITPATV